MGLEYSRSKSWLNWTLGLSFAILAMTILSIYMLPGDGPKVLGFMAALFQIFLFFSRHLSKYHFGLAEQIRRLAMLHDGLGINPSEDQIASIWQKVGNPQDAKPAYLSPYYESQSPKGHKRLLEITRESAFFSGSLANSSSIVFWTLAGLGFLVSALSFIALVQTGASLSTLETTSKAVVASMVFWVTGDLAAMAWQFKILAQTSERIQTQCANLLLKSENINDATHTIVGEYNCAVVQAPPIPEWIYKWRKNVLNEAWKNRQVFAGTSNAT